MFSNSNTNIANNNTVKKYDLNRRQSSLNADLSELPTMWLWMPLCVPLWNTIFETVANFLDIKFPLPLLRTSLVPIFGQRLHI